eukprot:135412_1
MYTYLFDWFKLNGKFITIWIIILVIMQLFQAHYINSIIYESNTKYPQLNFEYNFNVWLISTIGFNSSYLLIPYFISHYKSIGIKYTNVLVNINVNFSRDNITQFNLTTTYLDKLNIKYFVWTKHFTSRARRNAETPLLHRVPKTDYVLIADIDEFQDWKQANITNIYKFIKEELIPNDKEYVIGYLIDRFADNASVINISLSDNVEQLFKLYPFQCDFTLRIIRGWTNKVCLFKNVYNIHKSHHYVASRQQKYKHKSLIIKGAKFGGTSILSYKKFKIQIHHFKWTNKNIIQYLRNRMLHYKSLNMSWWKESYRAIKWIKKNRGKVDLNNVKDFKCIM